MYYVGFDVHLCHSNPCILDDRGRKVKAQTIRGLTLGGITALVRTDPAVNRRFLCTCRPPGGGWRGRG